MPAVLLLLTSLSASVPGDCGPALASALREAERQLEGKRVELLTAERGPVLLLEETGAMVAAQQLPAGSSCADLEEAIPVIASAWAARWAPQPEVLPAVPALEVATPDLAAPALDWALEAAGGLSLAGTAVAPAGFLQLHLWKHASHWGGALVLSVEGTRDVSLGPGSAQWMRTAVGLGPEARWVFGSVTLSAGADAQLAWVSAAGANQLMDETGNAFEPGLALPLRASVAVPGWGSLRPFVGLWPAAWLVREVAQLENTSQSHPLPGFELLAGIGLGWVP